VLFQVGISKGEGVLLQGWALNFSATKEKQSTLVRGKQQQQQEANS